MRRRRRENAIADNNDLEPRQTAAAAAAVVVVVVVAKLFIGAIANYRIYYVTTLRGIDATLARDDWDDTSTPCENGNR